MPISTGTKLGPYEIIGPLGAGGMGEVYRARDSALKREVALKVLPEAFARDPERMARFRREAELVAALNHYRIAHIYAVEQGALVMELVDGPTLAERIAAGPIPLEEALLIARQIAEALEAAHEKGIIHRDLKPANVKLTGDGQVKLLDFGLARALEDRAPAGDQADSPTLTIGASVAGVILGTAGYMSPEQARGAAVDKRTDIWAFGVVLYEMLTGRPMFRGESVSDTLAAVLRAEPDWGALPTNTPPSVRRLLQRCLERDRKKRLRDIGDAFLDMDDPQSHADRPKRTWAPWAIATAGCAAALALAFIHFRETPAQPPPARHLSFTPEPLDAASSFARRAVISPNGKHIAYVTQRKLWIRDLDHEEARQLSWDDNAVGPFWSPDSEFVGFAAGQDLMKISVQGGAAIRLCKLGGSYRGGTWSLDGSSIVYSLAGLGLLEIPAQGGTSKVVLPTETGSTFYAPQFLSSPAGQRLILLGGGFQTKQSIELANLATGERRKLHDGAYAIYSAGGHILFQTGAMEAGMWALPFSLQTAKPTGEAFPLVQRGGEWSLADDGTLVYVDFPESQNVQLIWRDRAGNKVGQIGQPQMGMRGVELSPDGDRVAVSAQEQGNHDIWIHEVASPIKTRLTFDPAQDGYPTWSPSGREIAFTGSGNQDISIQAADRSGDPKPLVATPALEFPNAWSPDGSTIVFTRMEPKTANDLWYIQRKPDGSFSEPVPFLQTPFIERSARISPNGRFVAYESDESGRVEVFVRPFPKGEGRSQVSANGGVQPRWSRDGKELFYLQDDTLMATPVSIAGSFSSGVPARLFSNSTFRGFAMTSSNYDVSRDGKRFVMAAPLDGAKSKPPSIHIVQNWQAVFRGRRER